MSETVKLSELKGLINEPTNQYSSAGVPSVPVSVSMSRSRPFIVWGLFTIAILTCLSIYGVSIYVSLLSTCEVISATKTVCNTDPETHSHYLVQYYDLNVGIGFLMCNRVVDCSVTVCEESKYYTKGKEVYCNKLGDLYIMESSSLSGSTLYVMLMGAFICSIAVTLAYFFCKKLEQPR